MTPCHPRNAPMAAMNFKSPRPIASRGITILSVTASMQGTSSGFSLSSPICRVEDEVFQAGGAMGSGGFVVDDPEDVFAGSVRREAGAKDAVDTDRDGADGGGPGCGWRGLLGWGGWRGP